MGRDKISETHESSRNIDTSCNEKRGYEFRANFRRKRPTKKRTFFFFCCCSDNHVIPTGITICTQSRPKPMFFPPYPGTMGLSLWLFFIIDWRNYYLGTVATIFFCTGSTKERKKR